jgi:hypothetical protein
LTNWLSGELFLLVGVGVAMLLVNSPPRHSAAMPTSSFPAYSPRPSPSRTTSPAKRQFSKIIDDELNPD